LDHCFIRYFILLLAYPTLSICYVESALSDGVIPSNQIQIINPRGEETGYSTIEDGNWQDYNINAQSDILIEEDEYLIKIYTGSSDASSKAVSEELDLTSLKDFKYNSNSFIRKLTSGKRWIICWSEKYELWAIDTQDGGVCFE
jgi:hypothetical protein